MYFARIYISSEIWGAPLLRDWLLRLVGGAEFYFVGRIFSVSSAQMPELEISLRESGLVCTLLLAEGDEQMAYARVARKKAGGRKEREGVWEGVGYVGH